MPRRTHPDDDRLEDAVALIRTHGWCTFQFIREQLQITGSSRGIFRQLSDDPRVQRTCQGHRHVWRAL
jgi:hypothetical protein